MDKVNTSGEIILVGLIEFLVIGTMHMSVFLCCLLLVASQPPSNLGPDAEQLARILGGLHEPISDAEMVCEGAIAFVDDTDPKKQEKSNRLNVRFQGNYAYRADGSCYLELFARTSAANSLLRTTEAVFQNGLTKITWSADQKPVSFVPQPDDGSPASLFHDGSPQRFILLWKWLPFLKNPKIWAYQAEGWDEVDGRRCLKIAFNLYPGSQAPATISRVWLDLERGGHVLKEEFRRDGELWYRIHNVKLQEFPLGQKKIWFPVHGEFDSFANGSRFLGHPVLHEVYDVVRGSLVFNQNLPDARFSVEWKGKKADTATASVAAERKEFQERQQRAKPKPTPRTDRAGVDADLDRQLAEADAKAPRVEAAPPSKYFWNAATLAQTVIATLSLGALIAAFVVMKRRK